MVGCDFCLQSNSGISRGILNGLKGGSSSAGGASEEVESSQSDIDSGVCRTEQGVRRLISWIKQILSREPVRLGCQMNSRTRAQGWLEFRHAWRSRGNSTGSCCLTAEIILYGGAMQRRRVVFGPPLPVSF